MSESSLSPIAGSTCDTGTAGSIPTAVPMASVPATTVSSTGATGATVTTDNRAIKDKAVAAKQAVASLAGEAKRYASHRVTDAKDTAAQWADTAKHKATDYSKDVADYVQRKPFQSIAIAAGIGFVAGLILKRR